MIRTLQLAARIVLGLALFAAPISADEVYLTDGRVLEGEITSVANADIVDIKVGIGSLSAIQHIERSKIRRITYGTSARQTSLAELQTRRAKVTEATSLAECWTLAQDAKALGDTVLYKEMAVQVVVRDRQHGEARKALGLVLYNGVWMRPSEAAAARGEVYFRGQWVAWLERDATLADESRRREEMAAARKAREEQRRLAAAAAAPVELQPETQVISYRSSPLLTPYRSTYWPAYTYPAYQSYGYQSYGGLSTGGFTTGGYTSGNYCPPGYPAPVFNLSASGGGSNHAWAFNWRL